ncbi:MAG: ABC transporter substrate-binding protein [Acidimicrobiia bacterium]
MVRTRLPLLALLLAFGVVAAACGQKADVASVSTGAGAVDSFGVADGGTSSGGAFDDVPVDVDGDGTPDADSSTGAGGGSTGAAARTGAGGQASTGGTSGGSGGGGGGGAAPAGGGDGGGGGAAPAGDRTGITDTEIVIGVHAPVTGAAPIPQSSFDEAKDVYWQFLNEQGGLFGRKVRVVFEDDQFDPRTAVAKCKKMVTEDKAFLLIGGGGADQITACAQYANSVGVPYLSAGVNEEGLAGVRAYFALSETYAQQSAKLVQLTRKQLGGGKFGIAVADSGSFNDAHASIVRAAQEGGLDVVYNKRIPKSASQNQALGIAAEMSSSGAEVVYFLSSPTTFLNVAAAAAGQGYRPQWIGPGLTSGLNTVAQVGCSAARSVDGAIFFSPFPQLDVIDRLDPDFRPSYGKYVGGDPDDLAVALWGLNKTVHQLFLAAGEGVTRQSFVQALEGGTPFETNVYPALQFSGQDHFGANASHVLQADCGSSSFKTIGTFVQGF